MAGRLNADANARIASFRVDHERWKDECTEEETSTPGIFYHGSPNLNLTEFKAQISLSSDVITQGIFFTHNPTYAAIYAVDRGFANGGRIYRSELITKSELEVSQDEWFGAGAMQRAIERDICAAARADGADSIVSIRLSASTILEIVVLDDRVVKRRDGHVGRVKDFVQRGMVFYQSDATPPPAYAPECIELCPDIKTARASGGASRAVGIDARIPIYCDKRDWPLMDFDLLREWCVDVLIDPADGSAVAVDRERVHPLNRKMRKALLSKSHAKAQRAANENYFRLRGDGARAFECDEGEAQWTGTD